MYTIKSQVHIVSSGLISPYAYFVRDVPGNLEESKKYLTQYICDVIEILKLQLDQFGDVHVPTSVEKEKRLRSMLDELIHAKRLWHEEYGNASKGSDTCTTR